MASGSLLLLVALALVLQTAAPQLTTPFETTTALLTTTTTLAPTLAVETTTALTTVTTTAAPTPAPATCPAFPSSAATLYSSLNVSTCAAVETCATARCRCQYGANASAATGNVTFGSCQFNGTFTSQSNCTEVDACLAAFFTCLHREALEDGACAPLGQIRAVAAKLDGKASSFPGSELEQVCRAQACRMADTLQCPISGSNAAAGSVCVVPLFNRAKLTIRGQWGSILQNRTVREQLRVAFVRSIASLFRVLERFVLIRDSDLTVASSRRAAGDLIVTFTLVGDALPVNTTFEQSLAAVQATVATGNTTWLAAVVQVYTSNGGSAAEIIVASVIDTTPVVAQPSTAPATPSPTGTTTGPTLGATINATTNFTAGPPVGGAASLATVHFAAIAAVLLACMLF